MRMGAKRGGGGTKKSNMNNMMKGLTEAFHDLSQDGIESKTTKQYVSSGI